MQARIDSNASCGLLPLRSAIELTGLSPNTLRRYSDSGEIPVVVLPSGHRRWERRKILEWLGLDYKEEGTSNKLMSKTLKNTSGENITNVNNVLGQSVQE